MPSLGSILSRSWWLLLLRGLAAIAFSVLLWLQPAITLVALVLLFGAYATADGVLGVWTAVSGRKLHEDWLILLLEGLLGIGVGVLTFVVDPRGAGLDRVRLPVDRAACRRCTRRALADRVLCLRVRGIAPGTGLQGAATRGRPEAIMNARGAP